MTASPSQPLTYGQGTDYTPESDSRFGDVRAEEIKYFNVHCRDADLLTQARFSSAALHHEATVTIPEAHLTFRALHVSLPAALLLHCNFRQGGANYFHIWQLTQV